MLHINIITNSKSKGHPNLDLNRFPQSEYDICFNSEEDKLWDCVVVGQNLPYIYKFRCRRGNVIYISGEPPMMFPCPSSFTNQFDKVVVVNKKIKHKNTCYHHGFVSWMMGLSFSTKEERYNYEELASLEPSKTKLISIVSSNQKMIPGHNRRMAIIEKLQRDYPNIIDVYGRGFNYVDCKADALLPYRFHICIENSTIPYYWTEKFADPILAQCVPIYCGCTNINDYFGNEGYVKFNINDYDSLKKIIDKILSNPDEEYLSRKSDLEKLRKLLMEKENIIPYIVNYTKMNLASEYKTYELTPLTECRGYSWQFLWLRVKRYAYKQFFLIFKK